MAFIGDAVAHAVFPGLAIAFIVSVSLDRETARAQEIPVLFFDLLLYVAVSLVVVMSVQTIGNVLVLALLVTPAATARLLVDRLTHMMFLPALIAVMGSVWGGSTCRGRWIFPREQRLSACSRSSSSAPGLPPCGTG